MENEYIEKTRYGCVYGKCSIIYIKWFCGLILPLLPKIFCTISSIFLFISLNINVSVLWEFQKWHSMLGLSFLMRVCGRKKSWSFFFYCMCRYCLYTCIVYTRGKTRLGRTTHRWIVHRVSLENISCFNFSFFFWKVPIFPMKKKSISSTSTLKRYNRHENLRKWLNHPLNRHIIFRHWTRKYT